MGSSFSIKQSGSFQKLETFLAKMAKDDLFEILDGYGREGVSALAAATPHDSGLTAESWYYEIVRGQNSSSITWHNDHVDDQGVPVVILLQYGHATGTGGYVSGYDFINPAIKYIMDDISDAVWKAVVAA